MVDRTSQRPHHHIGTSSSSSSIPTPISSLLPIQFLAFGLIHVVYQLILSASQLIEGAQRVVGATCHPAHCTDTTPKTLPAKVLRHLAVIFAPDEPSTWPVLLRTYLVQPLWQFLTAAQLTSPRRIDDETKQRHRHESALKTASDLYELIHLSSESGIATLSVYTPEPIEVDARLAAEQLLSQSGRFVIEGAEGERQEAAAHNNSADVESLSTSPEARRRQPSSSSSSRASDDGETSTDGTSKSEDDTTLASSNTSVAGDSSDDAVGDVTTKQPRVSVRLITTGVERMQWNRQVAASNEPAQQQLHQPTEASPVGVESRRIEVMLLSQDDGKLEMARSASEWARTLGSELLQRFKGRGEQDEGEGQSETTVKTREDARKCRRTMVKSLTPDRFDAWLLGQGTISEPDFLIIYNSPARVRTLHGFPPWPIRLTELYFDETSTPTRPSFNRALRYFAKTQHRYGR